MVVVHCHRSLQHCNGCRQVPISNPLAFSFGRFGSWLLFLRRYSWEIPTFQTWTTHHDATIRHQTFKNRFSAWERWINISKSINSKSYFYEAFLEIFYFKFWIYWLHYGVILVITLFFSANLPLLTSTSLFCLFCFIRNKNKEIEILLSAPSDIFETKFCSKLPLQSVDYCAAFTQGR